MSIAFLLTTLVVVVTPGTGLVYTLAAGLSRGRRASVAAAFGCTLAIVPHVLATVTGVAALLHASATAFQALKYAGVAYLLYMAWATVREKGAIDVGQEGAPPVTSGRVIVRAVLINLLNPKVTIFFLAFLPQFVSPAEPHAVPRMLMLGGVFMMVTFVVFVAFGLLAASVRSHVVSRPRVMTWLRRTFAGSFVALGAKLAFTAR
ncbi:lysine transporter LysE [Streptomyces spinoverrucosus]|uniref:Lysine transporter LysE n=1 Tax=Streptomyces spinoverrucosus TaxID=284043 RepID=A0A4Y3VJH6_9ACTN|nr:LysE family translocator [Streptomyces spinoverrucosus]GEC05940.1 lysine transporter LysE [Streptomyces spinoverrucosus]GHB74312.1 lysine transporter LysE [Streptomyces spinoverrucosus]